MSLRRATSCMSLNRQGAPAGETVVLPVLIPRPAGGPGVVDGRLADLDHQTCGGAEGDAVLGAEGGLFGAGQGAGVPGRDEADVAPVEPDGAAEVGVADVLDPLPLQPFGELDDS